MDESNAFTKRHVEEVTAAQRTLLDELNLPPAVKKYITDNARFLQVSFILVVAAICGWNYYSYYTTNKKDQGAQQLSQAMNITDSEQRTIALEKVSTDFSSAGSGIWSKITLAGDHVANKLPGEAIPLLQSLHEEVFDDNPLFPLLQQLSGAAYELSNEFDRALAHYEVLTTLPGFSAIGYIESGRVYELQGLTDKAKDAYEKANTADDIKPEQRAWIEDKINTL